MSKVTYKPISIIKAIFPIKIISFNIAQRSGPKRTVYYSSLLALASAALAFLGTHTNNDGVHMDLMLSMTVICFGMVIVLILILYFLQIIHEIHWGVTDRITRRMANEGWNGELKGIFKHPYLKKRPEEEEELANSIQVSVTLRSFQIVCDAILLLMALVAVSTYCAYLIS